MGTSLSDVVDLVGANKRTFEDVRESVVRLKGKLLAILHFWDSGLSSPDVCSFLEFLEKLSG